MPNWLKEKIRYKILKWLKVKPIGVFVVVKDANGQCLMVLHNWGMKKFSLPGGKLDKDELYSAGGIREVLEETGLEVKITRLGGMFRLRLDEGAVILYEGQQIGGKLQLTSSETTDCKYFSVTYLEELHRQKKVYNAQLSAVLWSNMPPRKDGLPHEGWLTVPPTPMP